MTERRFPRRFHDRLGYEEPGVRDLLRIFRTGGFSDPKAQAALAPRVPRARGSALASPEDGATRIAWVGHASFVVQLGGLTVLTDPVWGGVPGGVRRLVPAGVPWESLPPVDAVLVSHNHYDHLDVPTLKRLPRGTPCLVPARLGAWFRARGFTRVTELDWWEGAEVEGVRFDFVPSQHWSRRGPFDRNATLWGGWVATAPDSGHRVYFAGDSGYCDVFEDVGKRFPGIDLALLPIGAYEPRWFMKPLHMDPEEAVRAFLDLGARRFVPMHWGTFALTREPLLEPRERLLAAWAARGLPPESLWDLAVGEARALPA